MKQRHFIINRTENYFYNKYCLSLLKTIVTINKLNKKRNRNSMSEYEKTVLKNQIEVE